MSIFLVFDNATLKKISFFFSCSIFALHGINWLFSNGTFWLTWTPNHVESEVLSLGRHFSDILTHQVGIESSFRVTSGSLNPFNHQGADPNVLGLLVLSCHFSYYSLKRMLLHTHTLFQTNITLSAHLGISMGTLLYQQISKKTFIAGFFVQEF